MTRSRCTSPSWPCTAKESSRPGSGSSSSHGPGNDFPLTRERVLNAFNRFGDDMLRISGIGEFATSCRCSVPVSDATQLSRGTAVHRRAWLVLPAAQPVIGGRPIDRSHVRGSQCSDPRSRTCTGPTRMCRQIDQATVNRFKAIAPGLRSIPISTCPTQPTRTPARRYA